MADLDVRKDRIGGSEVAAIFGVHQFLTRFGLYYRKKFPDDAERPGERMVIGKLLERGLTDVYSYVTGRKAEYFDRTVLDPTRRYMVATPDAFCRDDRRGVELKVVQWDQVRRFGEGPAEIPPRIVLQCDWYMAAFDYDVWDVCAYLGTGAPRIYTLHRDAAVERAMLERVEEWHARYILGDEIPPLDASEESRRWLQEVYPAHKRPDMREAEPGEVKLLNEYVALRVEQKVQKARQVEMETTLKAWIKDREGLEWPDGRFTWRRTKDGLETDWQSMATGLLYGLPDEAQRAEILARYTHPKPGYRKIRIDHPALRQDAAEQETTTA
jgi:predicted phage-related endonuclease